MKPLRKGSSLADVVALRRPGFVSWEHYDITSPEQIRKTVPYRVGDVLTYLRGGKVEYGLLVRIGVEYLPRAMEFCVRFAARPQRKDGNFALAMVTVWPGDIQRAHEALHKETA